MKMGKKVREYKSGDFIFAKVKGYPAWPARVQSMNGKKYFVYFYGTGETANLPPSMIFDYAENKDKFLTKTVKRKVFNDGVKQIDYDFKNNVPLEQVIGLAGLLPEDTTANDTVNESAANDTLDDSIPSDADTTADNDITDDTANSTQNQTAVDDSDETAGLIIDEGKKGRKSTPKVSVTLTKPAKEPKTPRGKAKKDESKEGEEEEKKQEEIISRSGRKIRPKRYIDEQVEENTTLPSPAPKKRRGVSPILEKEKDNGAAKEKLDKYKHFNAVTQLELEDLKEPFMQEDADKENILIVYMPNGQYVGIKLFQSRPTSFKNEAARLNWDKQAASNAITLKLQLERGQITSQSVLGQLVTDLHLTDEEKATLDKERETEEKKSRVQFLKTEMKLIELDAKIKTCLSLEKADTELCLKLLDELLEIDVKPLMLLKHPTCLETVKRMRAYVGNTPSWDLSESAALQFSKQAHLIRKQAETLYKNMKELFTTPEGLSFWEYFSERVIQFKKVTAKLTPDELLEMVHEPLEMSVPTSHTMKASVEAANEEDTAEEDNSSKKKSTPVKSKKPNGTPSKPVFKRQSSRKQQQEEKDTNKNSDVVDDDTSKEKNISAKEKNDVAKDKKDEDKDEGSNMKDDTSKDIPNEENQKTVSEEQTEAETESQPVEDPKDKDKEKSPDPNPITMENDKSSILSVEQKSTDKQDNAEVTEKEKEKAKPEADEPRPKRSRESKKTEAPPPRSPTKRKSKF